MKNSQYFCSDSFGQYPVETSVRWLSEDVVSSKIEIEVYEKFAKMKQWFHEKSRLADDDDDDDDVCLFHCNVRNQLREHSAWHFLSSVYITLLASRLLN